MSNEEKLLKRMNAYSKTETIFATEYHNGMKDGWSLFSGDSLPSLIFRTKKEAMIYVRKEKLSKSKDLQSSAKLLKLSAVSSDHHNFKNQIINLKTNLYSMIIWKGLIQGT